MNRTSALSRRSMLQRCGMGFGMLGLAGVLDDEGLLAADALADRALNPMAPQRPHFAPKAKRVIWLLINGGPSHIDTWDHKPALAKHHGQELEGFDKFTGFFSKEVGALMKSPFQFSPRGQSGKMVSELFPHLGEHVDKMAFIHSGHSDSNNHSPALFMINSGQMRMGFPVSRLVGHLRAWQPEPQSARIRRHVGSKRAGASQEQCGELERGLPPRRLSGHLAAPDGRADPESQTCDRYDGRQATRAARSNGAA